jgi:prephenate dehydratase
VSEKRAKLAMIPIENSVAGRVADIHHLLPDSGLHIIDEHFQRVNHHLLAPHGASLSTIKVVRSHVQALSQVRKFLKKHGFKPEIVADTAGAARDVAVANDVSVAAVASRLAAETYDLAIVTSDIEDAAHNTTRFVVMSREPFRPDPGSPCLTTFVFNVRSVPAALYKALGGFATNGVNMTKLESYQVGGSFAATKFYADIVGAPGDERIDRALEELDFQTKSLRLLGSYPQARLRP